MVRDRLGVKPLFYSITPEGTLIFGSELKVLLPVPWARKKLDPLRVEEYFAYGYVPEPNTIFEGIKSWNPVYPVDQSG